VSVPATPPPTPDDKISGAQAKVDARKAELEKELLEHTERLAKYAKKVRTLACGGKGFE